MTQSGLEPATFRCVAPCPIYLPTMVAKHGYQLYIRYSFSLPRLFRLSKTKIVLHYT
jgi:hypothetical protein